MLALQYFVAQILNLFRIITPWFTTRINWIISSSISASSEISANYSKESLRHCVIYLNYVILWNVVRYLVSIILSWNSNSFHSLTHSVNFNPNWVCKIVLNTPFDFVSGFSGEHKSIKICKFLYLKLWAEISSLLFPASSISLQ